MRLHKVCLIIIVIVLSSIVATKSYAQAPDWFIKHLQYMTQGSGTWLADNSGYMNDSETIDTYVTEWKWGVGKQSLTGRLYGLQDGQETETYWEFRTFWNPVEQKAYAYQFGADGAVGIGEIYSDGEGITVTEQTFYNPDGTTAEVGHRSTEKENFHETQSYTITQEGEWVKRRFYRWELRRSESYE